MSHSKKGCGQRAGTLPQKHMYNFPLSFPSNRDHVDNILLNKCEVNCTTALQLFKINPKIENYLAVQVSVNVRQKFFFYMLQIHTLMEVFCKLAPAVVLS